MVIKRIFSSETYDRIMFVVLVAIALWFFCVNLNFWATKNPLIDDAFIEFRNSFNLVHHYGLVWNPGEAPTESSSNLLAVLFFAPFILFKFDPVIVSHILGIVSVLATGFLLYSTCLRYGINKLAALLSACIYVCIPAMALQAFTGFQTPLFCFILFFFFSSVLRAEKGRQSANIILLFSFLLLILARPEGVFFGVLFFAFVYVFKNGLDFYRNKRFFVSVSFCIALGAIYLLWKYFYFGSILSSPFIVKASNPLYLPGKCELILFVLRYPIFFLFAFIGAVSNYRKNPAIPHCVFFILLILAAYLFNCHLNGYESRFFLPALPFLLVLIALAFDSLLTIFSKKIFKSLFLTFSLVLFNPSVVNPPGTDFVRIRKLFFCLSENRLETAADVNIKIAKQLAKIKNHSQLVVVAEDPGALGYYSGTRVIDPAGLTNIHFARCKTKEEFVGKVFSYNPDLIVFRTAISPQDYDELERNRCTGCTWGALGKFGRVSIIESRHLKDRYLSIGKILEADISASAFFWNFWLRKDSLYYQEVYSALGELINH